jgi:hypothetical protein
MHHEGSATVVLDRLRLPAVFLRRVRCSVRARRRAGGRSAHVEIVAVDDETATPRTRGGAGKILKEIQAWLSIRRQDVRRRW